MLPTCLSASDDTAHNGIIILADVAHNTYYVALNQQWLEPFYLSQVVFLVAVFLLSPIAWNFTRRRVALINTIRL